MPPPSTFKDEGEEKKMNFRCTKRTTPLLGILAAAKMASRCLSPLVPDSDITPPAGVKLAIYFVVVTGGLIAIGRLDVLEMAIIAPAKMLSSRVHPKARPATKPSQSMMLHCTTAVMVAPGPRRARPDGNRRVTVAQEERPGGSTPTGTVRCGRIGCVVRPSGTIPAMSPMMLTSSVFAGTTILVFSASAFSTVMSFLRSCALPTKYFSAASFTS